MLLGLDVGMRKVVIENVVLALGSKGEGGFVSWLAGRLQIVLAKLGWGTVFPSVQVWGGEWGPRE